MKQTVRQHSSRALQKYLINNKYISLHLVRKYTCLFVRGLYLLYIVTNRNLLLHRKSVCATIKIKVVYTNQRD